ncbi:MAG: LysM peptidoglycan-binding domain-containing protein [Candidatus Cloacimonetes bacterium]|nr:LysM peptidoglycan-binding domain-containing protein [Candidatus Cloacimonadota bacterium]
MTWTHDGKPWGNCWGAEIEIIRGGGPIRVRNPDGTYTVQAGDSLYWIARSFGATVAAIAEANGITNPDMIFVGQKLIIP